MTLPFSNSSIRSAPDAQAALVYLIKYLSKDSVELNASLRSRPWPWHQSHEPQSPGPFSNRSVRSAPAQTALVYLINYLSKDSVDSS